MRDERFSFAECPMTRSMGMIGSKWKPIVINAIQKRRIRFGQLDAIIPLITRKVLTEQLKELEEDGIVLREYHSELPPRVEYSLTEKGLELLPILTTIVKWNLKHEGIEKTRK
ncbi:MAG TPA: helix-turn-helix domain-containing protein [Chryseolinea sp.]|nr:helix-turn-helix domain-containing protein [Chryseolinea sp.]